MLFRTLTAGSSASPASVAGWLVSIGVHGVLAAAAVAGGFEDAPGDQELLVPETLGRQDHEDFRHPIPRQAVEVERIVRDLCTVRLKSLSALRGAKWTRLSGLHTTPGVDIVNWCPLTG